MQSLRDKLELLMRRQIKVRMSDAYNSEGIKMYVLSEAGSEYYLVEEVGVDYFIVRTIKKNGKGTRNLFNTSHLRVIDDLPAEM